MSPPPRVRVFLGPTLPHAEARQLLDADYRPPATDADLPAALADGVEVIGIIDAAFFQSYSATPTQILDALGQGVVVFGAASAGALRAVELHRYGMRGVGGIYRLFRDTAFDAEDELAVAFDPAALCPLSEAMINIRHALGKAYLEGVITRASHDELLELAKGIYFPHRSYRALLQLASGRVPNGELAGFRSFVDARRDDLDWKADDARACLRAIDRYLVQREQRDVPTAGTEHQASAADYMRGA